MTPTLVTKPLPLSQRARILRKIGVSLGVGSLAYLITNMLATTSVEPQLLGLTLSVFIGGVTLVTQVLVDFESRLVAVEQSQERHARRTENLVREGYSKINNATALFSRVEASGLETDAVMQVVQNSTQLHPSSPELIFSFAKAELDRTAQFLKELSEGANVTYDGEDRDWMLALARHVTISIDATSLNTVDAGGRGFDGGLWNNHLGRRYLQAQREAIRRGVKIRRVFIVDDSSLAEEPAFREVCARQCKLGIQVRTLDSSQVKGIRRSSLFDFVLFDNVISYEVTPAPGGVQPAIVDTRLELRPERVGDRIERFEDLWAAAEEFVPEDPAPAAGDQPVNT